MNFKQYLGDFNYFIIRIFVLVVSLFTLVPFAAYSNEDSYKLTKVAQLEHQLISNPIWQQIIANPSNKKQHFIISEPGQVYLIDDDEINPKAILDMRVFQKTDSSLFKLTAIELHPNFSLRNQVGYGTFYTAHIETIETVDKKSKTMRLQERGDDLQLNFDAVITEWQFNPINHQKVNINTKREVLRIGVPDNLMVIKQMSFSPSIKSWNDDFGLLYVALSGEKKWPQPLYSGVILRIDPAKFGLRSFRIPENNPHMKNNQIHDAIYLLGGQKIEQFIWPGKNSEHLLVSHHYDKKYLLSLTDGRDDWRDSSIKQIFYQSDDAVHDLFIYRGRQLPLLRSKLLLLRKKEQQWFVDSLVFDPSENKKIRDEKKAKIEWAITSEQLPTDSQIILSRNDHGDIFLLEKTINILFRITEQALVNKTVVVDSGENKVIETKPSDKSIFILLFILALSGAIYYWFKRNSLSFKTVVRQQFASLELSGSCQQIGLHHRHQRNAETLINVADIVSCEIKLNEHIISVVNDQLGHGFNKDKEEDLRTIFINEKIDKMVDGKIRQVSILLTDKQKNCYTVCLYMRKGSNRLTKKSYVMVINELIDWCWFFGEKLNAEGTDKREVKTIVLPKDNADVESNKHNKAPLHIQAAALRSVIHKTDNADQPIENDGLSPSLSVVNGNKHLTELSSEKNRKQHSQDHQNNTIDTELVNALEKLVNLKKQGFLTMDEFSKAKEKLLKNLCE